jgi:hypothetical protein
MDGIHPKFVLSKRFPVHAAVEQLNLPELGTYHVPIIRKKNVFFFLIYLENLLVLEKLLTPASDARFHFGRKLTGTEISVLHQVKI